MNEIFIILLLILLNGVFAMSEIAIISVRKGNMQQNARRGSKRAKTVMQLAENPDRFLSTVQIGITLIGILTGIYSGAALADGFALWLQSVGLPAAYARVTAQAVIVVSVTFASIVMGELIPKRIGMAAAERVALAMAVPMMALSRVASPFVWLLSKATHAALSALPLKEAEVKVTEAEIRQMVQEGKEDGTVEAVEQDIVERVFLLGDQKVSSLMTHRSDITALDVGSAAADIKATIGNNMYESYPVIDGQMDHILGMVSLKDLVLQLSEPGFTLRGVMRPAVYFHENMSVYKALEQMKERRLGQVFVCDEFGCFQGIVTLRDILEGLVGDISNPSDTADIVVRDDGQSWLVDGQCAFFNMLSFFDMDDLYDPATPYNTVAGLVIDQLKHIPTAGEVAQWQTLRFEVVDMDGARIDKLLVTKTAGE